MRFRRDKGDGGEKRDGAATQDTVETPALSRTALGEGAPEGRPADPPPPSGSDRVDAPPPPSAADRAEDPVGGATEVLPPSADTRVEEPAKVLPPSGSDRVEAPPPRGTDRLESPGAAGPTAAAALAAAGPPTATARVDAPPPTPGARVDSPAAAAPPQPGQLVSSAPPPGAGAATSCPNCGAPAEAGQEMCIVCGNRIAREPFGASKRRGWLLPALAAALGVLLLGTAIAFAVVELTGDDDVKKDDVADLNEGTQPSTPAPPADQAPPATTPQTTPTTPTTPPTTPETAPPENLDPDTTPPTTPDDSGGGQIAEWPAGRTAYTVVLVSATSRNAADAKAEQAIKRGIEAGVLRSDDFSTLRAGYWVVFAGQYDTSEQATRAADRYAEQGFGGGYPRQVKPK